MMTVSVITSCEISIKKQLKSTRRCSIPKRFIVTILAFIGMFSTFAMRSNMSVVMVAMVNTTDHKFRNSSWFDSGTIDGADENSPIKGGQNNWDSKTQGSIMGAFFYAYFITTLCGGYLAERFGAKMIFGGSILLTAIFTLLTPISVKWGYVGIILLRCLIGFCEGAVFPSVMVIISRWAPKSERTRIAVTMFNGSLIGTVIGFLASGWLSSTNFLGGWPSVFYVFGAFSCIWCIIWFLLISETPQIHPSITDDELSLYSGLEGKVSRKRKVSWASIFTSLPFWAAFVSNFGTFFSSTMVLLELPTYLSSVLHFNIAASGLLSTVPYIIGVFGMSLASYVADKLRNSERLQITTIRKLMDAIGGYGLSACFVGVAVSGYRPYLIVILFCIGMFVNGFKSAGFMVTYTDMSPDFSGTTYGITNGVSSLTGIMGPAMVGAFIKDGATLYNWGKVFYATAAVHSITTTFFVIFASAELQSWGKAEYAAEGKEKDKEMNIK